MIRESSKSGGGSRCNHSTNSHITIIRTRGRNNLRKTEAEERIGASFLQEAEMNRLKRTKICFLLLVSSPFPLSYSGECAETGELEAIESGLCVCVRRVENGELCGELASSDPLRFCVIPEAELLLRELLDCI